MFSSFYLYLKNIKLLKFFSQKKNMYYTGPQVVAYKTMSSFTQGVDQKRLKEINIRHLYFLYITKSTEAINIFLSQSYLRSLEATGCASSRLQSLCYDQKLWYHICSSNWPSTLYSPKPYPTSPMVPFLYNKLLYWNPNPQMSSIIRKFSSTRILFRVPGAIPHF